jgi:hypothetical protein
MAAIVLPDIVRYSIIQRLGSRPVVNILDMYLDDADLPQTRDELLLVLAEDIITAWNLRILPLLSDDLEFQEVRWVDLDTADGSVGSTSTAGEIELPAYGGQTAQTMPGMVCARIIKETTGGRRARRGRMYLSGVPEAYTDDPAVNTLSAGARANIESALEDFRDDLTTGLGPLLDIARPVVVHDPKDAPPSYTDLTGYSVDPIVGAQRRRSRG